MEKEEMTEMVHTEVFKRSRIGHRGGLCKTSIVGSDVRSFGSYMACHVRTDREIPFGTAVFCSIFITQMSQKRDRFFATQNKA